MAEATVELADLIISPRSQVRGSFAKIFRGVGLELGLPAESWDETSGRWTGEGHVNDRVADRLRAHAHEGQLQCVVCAQELTFTFGQVQRHALKHKPGQDRLCALTARESELHLAGKLALADAFSEAMSDWDDWFGPRGYREYEAFVELEMPNDATGWRADIGFEVHAPPDPARRLLIEVQQTPQPRDVVYRRWRERVDEGWDVLWCHVDLDGHTPPAWLANVPSVVLRLGPSHLKPREIHAGEEGRWWASSDRLAITSVWDTHDCTALRNSVPLHELLQRWALPDDHESSLRARWTPPALDGEREIEIVEAKAAWRDRYDSLAENSDRP